MKSNCWQFQYDKVRVVFPFPSCEIIPCPKPAVPMSYEAPSCPQSSTKFQSRAVAVAVDILTALSAYTTLFYLVLRATSIPVNNGIKLERYVKY